MDQFAQQDATGLARLVASGDVHPRELVEAAIGRIERVDLQINAVVHRRFDRALDEASNLAMGGAFRGVPIVLKDLGAPMAGEPLHAGMRAAKAAGWVSGHSGAVTSRLCDAGFIVLGRTNTPELGTTITTEPIAYGPTRNPWNLERSAGGSSGGSAAAVASGMVAVAHGSDGGGSIRIPASNCALVGLKPSRGRVSKAPDRGESWMGCSTDGALTRTVRDAAAVLDVLAGPEVGDPYCAPPLPGPLREEVGRPPGRLRIGVLDHPPASAHSANPVASAAVHSAAELLDELGHHVESAFPEALKDEQYSQRFLAVVAAGVATDLLDWERRLGRTISDEELEPDNAALRAAGRSMTAPEYLEVVNWLHAFSRRVTMWWAEGWDLLITPVLNGPPPALGWLSDPGHSAQRVVELAAYTSQFNVTGQPAISLPLHWHEGMPIGVQLVATAGREDLLIRVASQLEGSHPWDDRYPTFES